MGNDAVEAVVMLLNSTRLPHFRGQAFYYERPTGTETEEDYIVVNHLPFVHKGEVGEGKVNINIHLPQLSHCQPDSGRFSCVAWAVASLFPKNKYIKGAYYEFLTDSRPTLDNDGTYYVNIQLKVTFNDLQY